MFFKKASEEVPTCYHGYFSNIYDRLKNAKTAFSACISTENTYDPYQLIQHTENEVQDYLQELDDEDDEDDDDDVQYYDAFNDYNDEKEDSLDGSSANTQKVPDLQLQIEAAEIIIRGLLNRKRESIRELILRRAKESYR